MMTPEELRLWNDKQKTERSSTNLKDIIIGTMLLGAILIEIAICFSFN